jgi:cell division protein FtsB
MDIPDNIFALVIVLVITATFLAATWMRTRSRHMAATGDKANLASERRIESLSTENEGLKGQVSRLEQRLAVLERIATDPAERTAREIENLR